MGQAKEIIFGLYRTGVRRHKLSTGKPLLYFDDMAAHVKVCGQLSIYARVVTNRFWAKTAGASDHLVSEMRGHN